MRICGQVFTPGILDQIRQTVAVEPTLSRRALSRRVCQWLNWRSGNGEWQEGGCRKALAELVRRQVLPLPSSSVPFAPRQAADLMVNEAAVETSLDALGPINLVVITDHRSREALTWRVLMQRHHYLGDKPHCGAQLRYVIQSERHGWLGALGFNSASWALRDRDVFIGWDETARRQNLNRVIANSRFLILPSVRVPNLASHVLGLIADRLATDWEARYGVVPVLLETFVNPTRFTGACYRAANWRVVGQTAGRRDGIVKHILLYPLQPAWRDTLCAASQLRLGSLPRPSSPAHWAEEEFGTLRLHDDRLRQRLFHIAQDFYHHPEANIPQACGSKARTMGAYRFFNNDKVTMDVILTPHLEATIERIKSQTVVLAPQDTTTLNYHHHPATTGLGPVNGRQIKGTGLMLHDTVAFSEKGTPLGVIDAQCWARDPDDLGHYAKRRYLPIEQKESMKWLRSYRKLAEVQALCPDTMLISVGDREADLHELFTEATRDPAGPKLLVRAERSRKRRVENASLWHCVTGQPVAGELELAVPKRGNRPARTALLTVRFARVEVQAPLSSHAPPVGLWAVHLSETAAADGGKAIEWMLLTTVAVETFAQAVQRAQWYAARWGIEVYHRTLKSGCRIKDRQLGTAQGLQACLGVDMVVAWRIYHLTLLAREQPSQPCTAFFDDVEWQALHCYHHKTPIVPEQPPSLAEATCMVGAMGGHLGRKGDGPPGTQVLWRGLQALDMAVHMYMIFTQLPAPVSWRSYPSSYLPPPNGP